MQLRTPLWLGNVLYYMKNLRVVFFFFFNLKGDNGIKLYICSINTYFLAPPGALLGFVVCRDYVFIIVLFWIPWVLLYLLLWCQLDTSGTTLWMPLSVDLKSAASEITNILARWESCNSKYFAWLSKVYCSFITCALVLNCFVFLIACLGYWTCWWTVSHGDFSWRKTAVWSQRLNFEIQQNCCPCSLDMTS